MARKKGEPAKGKDRHTGFVVRLPMGHHDALSKLKAKNRRTMVQEVQIALEKHYRDEGIEWEGPK